MNITFLQGKVTVEGVYGEPEISPSIVTIDDEEIYVNGKLTENEAIRTALLERAVSNRKEGLTLEEIGVEPIVVEVEFDNDFIVNDVDMFFNIVNEECFIPNRSETILKVKEGLLNDEEKEIYSSLEEEFEEQPKDEDILLEDLGVLSPIVQVYEDGDFVDFEIKSVADFKKISRNDGLVLYFDDIRNKLYHQICNSMKDKGWSY